MTLSTHITIEQEGPRPCPFQYLPPRRLAWTDPVIDTLGHDPRSWYVEQFWLGIIGPTTIEKQP
jgi:hypothetical protein